MRVICVIIILSTLLGCTATANPTRSELAKAWNEYELNDTNDLGASENDKSEIGMLLTNENGYSIDSIQQFIPGMFHVWYCYAPGAIDGCDEVLIVKDGDKYSIYSYVIHSG
jgi:hypothetical protein